MLLVQSLNRWLIAHSINNWFFARSTSIHTSDHHEPIQSLNQSLSSVNDSFITQSITEFTQAIIHKIIRIVPMVHSIVYTSQPKFLYDGSQFCCNVEDDVTVNRRKQIYSAEGRDAIYETIGQRPWRDTRPKAVTKPLTELRSSPISPLHNLLFFTIIIVWSDIIVNNGVSPV